MPAVKILTNRNARALDKYLETAKEGVDGPRVLDVDTRYCRRETAVAEFAATRELCGTNGATRKVKATYQRVDPDTGLTDDGEPGTHVMRYTGGRWRRMPVRPGESATHRRIESEERVRSSEVVHTIYAFGLDEVNPNDADAVERAVEGVFAERRANYSGLQEKLVAQADSGKLHVHVMSNATVHTEFDAEGHTFHRGQRMTGVLTDIHEIRRRADDFYEAHPEHGIHQHMARVGTPEYEAAQRRSGQRDYHNQRRAQAQGTTPVESNQAKIRRLTHEALNQGDGTMDAYVADSAAAGVEVKEVGLRRGKPTKSHDLSYRLDGSNAWVRGKTLGPWWTHEAISDNLGRRAAGQPITQPPAKQQAGPPKPLPTLSDAERAQLKVDIDAYADLERQRQAAEAAEAARQTSLATPTSPSAAQPAVSATPASDETPSESESSAESSQGRDVTPPGHAPAAPRAARAARAATPPSSDAGAPGERPETSKDGQDPAFPAPRKETALARFTAYGDHDLLVVDRGLRYRDGDHALDVQLDARDPAARNQAGLHLARDSRVTTPEHATQSRYTPEQAQAIRSAAGRNVQPIRGDDGKLSGVVYGVRGRVVPAGIGDGLIISSNRPITAATKPVGADWQARQHDAEDQVRQARSAQSSRASAARKVAQDVARDRDARNKERGSGLSL